ncbi:MAG: hypothetical protein KBB26_04865, partial [Candidatus Omnitrophica bacterium]|nr:hypothetical protein [Candidatus Omnitrophota bacterium]
MSAQSHFCYWKVFPLILLVGLGLSCEKKVADGVQRTYFKNGKIRGEYTYKNGVKQGLFREFDESGDLIREGLIQGDKTQMTEYTY